MASDRQVELSPQNAYIRRLQHQLAQKYSLLSRSRGREPLRRVRIYREGGAGDGSDDIP
jgi:predicted RNA-binding protein Jag